MTKNKIKYVCVECKHSTAQWLGKCPRCNSWNTFHEELKTKLNTTQSNTKKPIPLGDITSVEEKRYSTGLIEFDRVLGGGFVKDSLTLIGGDPGIGKSTLLLQTCGNLARLNSEDKILYVTGEESESQIFLRSKRLNINEKNILVLNETSLDEITLSIKELKPAFLILDSIQTTISSEVNGSAGSLTQIKETTFEIMNLSKGLGVTSIIIGHVTKDGSLAGPKILEHMVDTVISFEQDKCEGYRVLRSIKNRFGSNSEVGIFQMGSRGLKEINMIKRTTTNNKFGSAWTTVLEGNRSLIIEIQSLVNENKTSYGKRICQGVDQTRVNILIAIIEKYLGISLSNFDIFINITEGISTKSSSIDLCIIASILSSYFLKPVDEKLLIIGEVGLTGSIAITPNIEKRLSHIKGQGFTELISNIRNKKAFSSSEIKYCKIENLQDLIEFQFPKKLAV